MPYGSAGPRVLRRVTATLVVFCALLVAVAPAARAEDYIAMGDSYASGTGTREYYEGCQRSTHAYPQLIRGSFGSSFRFVACSGAKTGDVLANQVNALSAATKHVTLSIGGNDAGFSDVITTCAEPEIPFTNPCANDVNAARSYISNTLPGRLDQVYTQIKQRAPNAVVAIVGYPRLFNGTDCNALTFFSGDDMSRLNGTADLLASVTRSKARQYGFAFVDVRQAFVGHAVCDAQEWLNGLSNPTGESYHPNRAGHSSGYANMVRATMQAAAPFNAPTGGVGRVAFSSTRTGNGDVYAVNGDGQFPVRLTSDAAADVDPAWSPDGTKIAFASSRDGDNEIYVMDGDGANVVKLTNNTSDDREPAWSPNGAYLAFRSDRTGNNEIFRMTAGGGSQTNLTNNAASDFAPDWSPDGAEIAFQRFTGGTANGQGNEVFKANADGQGQLNLTNTAASVNDGKPAWSPSGAEIAFHSNRTTSFDVWTMGAGGETPTRRTTDAASDQDPAWAPNGQSIAFTSTRSGNDDVFTMTSTGGSQINRTSNAASDAGATWQADSTPPATTITAGPSGPVADARPAFSFTSSELGSRLECRIDTAAFAVCASPFQPSAALAQGEHTFAVRSTDPAGNADTTPATRTFIVDTVQPALTVECPPSALYGSEATVRVTASDATSGIATIDDPSGVHELDTSTAGRRTYSAQTVDRAGNTATAECTYLVGYPDPGAPALAGATSPNRGDFGLTWAPSADSASGIRYVVERRDAAASAWEQVRSGLADAALDVTAAGDADEGTWAYRVKGVDAEHGVETGWSAASAPVVVDRSAPRAPEVTPARSPDFAGDGGWFKDEVVVTTTDRGDPALRDGSDGSGVDPGSVTPDEPVTASTTLRRAVRDRAGNASTATALAVQVDDRAPSLSVTCPQQVELLDDATVEIAASDGESGLADDPSEAVRVDTSRVGRQAFERTATDRVGHRRTESCSVLVVYPTPGAPRVTRGGSVNAGSFALGWKASAPASYPLRYALERRAAAGGEWAAVRDGLADPEHAFAAGDDADEGTWVYRVRGVDAENDVTTPWSEASDPVKVDQTAPAAPSLSADRDPEYAGDGGWYKDEVVVTTTDNGDPALRDGSAGSGVDPDSIAGPRALTSTTTLTRTALDRVGNRSAARSRAYQVDTQAPELTLTCPTSVVLRGSAVVEVAASDEQSGLDRDPSATIRVDTSEVGPQTFERTATDRVGHRRTESCTVIVRYAHSGLLQPVNRDGSSIFRLGSTVPLKLDLTDASGTAVTTAAVEVRLERVSTTIEGETVESVVNATPTNGKLFEYSGGHYQFNLSTKPLTTGTWRIVVTPGDGMTYRTRISLR